MFAAVFTSLGASASLTDDGFRLTARFGDGELKSWSSSELGKLKTVSSKERDPKSGEVVRWKGVLLSSLVENALGQLPPESRALVDLVILKNDAGAQALIPRAFIVKYPVMLALDRESQKLDSPASVVPWTSVSKVMSEGVPLESFFLSKVSTVEFVNYRERFGTVFLKRRTDPAAMRGEKVFVQSCVGCHGSGVGPAPSTLSTHPRSRDLASEGHPAPAQGPAPKLGDREIRALKSYLDAYRAENGLAPQASVK